MKWQRTIVCKAGNAAHVGQGAVFVAPCAVIGDRDPYRAPLQHIVPGYDSWFEHSSSGIPDFIMKFKSAVHQSSLSGADAFGTSVHGMIVVSLALGSDDDVAPDAIEGISGRSQLDTNPAFFNAVADRSMATETISADTDDDGI